jgi:hypothetical protein
MLPSPHPLLRDEHDEDCRNGVKTGPRHLAGARQVAYPAKDQTGRSSLTTLHPMARIDIVFDVTPEPQLPRDSPH